MKISQTIPELILKRSGNETAGIDLTKYDYRIIFMVFMEVVMHEVVFESQLLKDGHLYCPKEYAKPRARFKVIVSLPDENATDSDIELASVIDQSDEFLSEEEIDYYMSLDEK